MSELRTVVENFTNQLAQVIEAQIMQRARHAVAAALGGNAVVPARRGRPPKSLALAGVFSAASLSKKPRKKAPKQLCPVPGCSNPAAPVFGMVCSKHKDVAKTKIRKYREARRAKKTKGGPTNSAKTRRVVARGRKKIGAAKTVVKKVVAAAPPAAAAPAA